MKIVVIGGTGAIGAKVVAILAERGVDAVAASPSTGVDVASGEGLAGALAGARAVVDVSKPHTYVAAEVDAYFRAAAEHLVAAERAAGVTHHVALAAVGTDDPDAIAYYRAKAAGERIIRESRVPASFVRATQFFEFFPAIADVSTRDGIVVLPPVLVQPIAGSDVAQTLVQVAMGGALEHVLDLAGPERMPLADFVRRGLRARGDRREVVVDASATYFGGRIAEDALLPGEGALTGPTRFDDWLARHTSA